MKFDVANPVPSPGFRVSLFVDARNLDLASESLFRARGQLGPDATVFPETAASLTKLELEVESRKTDRLHFEQLLSLASDAQSKMIRGDDLGGENVAFDALQLLDVANDQIWLERLKNSYLTVSQKNVKL